MLAGGRQEKQPVSVGLPPIPACRLAELPICAGSPKAAADRRVERWFLTALPGLPAYRRAGPPYTVWSVAAVYKSAERSFSAAWPVVAVYKPGERSFSAELPEAAGDRLVEILVSDVSPQSVADRLQARPSLVVPPEVLGDRWLEAERASEGQREA